MANKKEKKVKAEVVKKPLHSQQYTDCMAAHQGQAGVCTEAGTWIPAG